MTDELEQIYNEETSTKVESDAPVALDFTKIESSIKNLDEIEARIEELKGNLLLAPDIDDYKELAAYVDTLTQILWNLEFFTWDIEDIQDKLDNDRYNLVRPSHSSDKKAEVDIDSYYHENKSQISHYNRLAKRLRTRYGGLTKVLDWVHDWFYFSSRNV